MMKQIAKKYAFSLLITFSNKRAFQWKANCPLSSRPWDGAGAYGEVKVNKFEHVLGWR